MKHFLSGRLIAAWAAVLVAALSISARAEDYPAKPVRVIVANSVGSLSDVVSRVVFSKVSELLGQSFVVDNRPGAGGTIAGDAVAKSAPDGYTLLFASDSVLCIAPHVYATLPYDPLRDFAPVSLLTKIPQVFVAHPSLGVKSLDALIELARSRPGKINYSSGGPGHATHLGMELFLLRTGLQMEHVPYKGTGPATQAVIAGEVGVSDLGLGIVLAPIQDGRLIGLAVSGPRIEGVLPSLPDLSTRVKDADYVSWQAVFAPARTPRSIIDRLNAALLRAMESSDVKARMLDTGMPGVSSTPEELGKLVARDLAVDREIARRVGLKPQ